ncbi:mucin-17 isoform X2 [Scaptodrosophila lebanonensis]|uniref:Mucin-17 isoform X2 n=1 Tax=Drosophila lebanonensis TaxID=7225 RepID=A0A6J2U060_DROLE|nr:mucin-17 isoform X2 [Scaptodrosophila lebanonensis]
MAKDPANSRIPRFDGISRIPQPGSLPSGLTSHIRPPTAATALSTCVPANRTTHNFRKPAVPGIAGAPRPKSFQATGNKPELSNTLKKSASGGRLNNAVNLLSKQTTTVLKKYFGKPATSTSEPSQMTCSLPITPVPVPKRAMVYNEALTTSTPMPLLRSETFVYGDGNVDEADTGDGHPIVNTVPPLENGKERGHYQSTPLDVLRPPRIQSACDGTPRALPNIRSSNFGFSKTIDMDSSEIRNATIESACYETPSRTLLSTRISNIGFGKTIDIDSPGSRQANVTHSVAAMGRTMPVVCADVTDGDRLCSTDIEPGNEKADGTHTINTTATNFGMTMHVITAANLTNIIVGEPSSELASPLSNATYSRPGSMDNLPLLEHMSMPSGLNLVNVKPISGEDLHMEHEVNNSMDVTLMPMTPDKANMKLPLNSTLNTERLLDITGLQSPAHHIQLLNLTREFMETTPPQTLKLGQRSGVPQSLMYLTPQSATTTPDRNTNLKLGVLRHQQTPVPVHLLSPLLKGAQSDLVLPTRTPEDEEKKAMETDDTLVTTDEQQQLQHGSLQDVQQQQRHGKSKSRYSFGLDLPDSTLDCSIELVDNSFSSMAARNSLPGSNMSQSSSSQQLQQQLLKKQHSFDLDESLGILTPDQMKEFLDSTTNNMSSQNNLELPVSSNNPSGNRHGQRLSLQQLRMDQTPSPEELPLDPVEVKTDITELLLQQRKQQQTELPRAPQFQNASLQSQNGQNDPHSLLTDTEHSKAEPLSKSCNSKISNSFITSVTSVTSLDTGYQGDGEMSRPASRGACDHSPSNGGHARKLGVSRQPSFQQQPAAMAAPAAPMRRQDPMTDSDFFTESDADDVLQRGDRRAQVIDGQLYGPAHMQPSASVFISEDPQLEDSCMESSGIFTDVENRCDEDPSQMRRQHEHQDVDMSPDNEGGDDSTGTVRSQLRLRKNASGNALGQGRPHSSLLVHSNSCSAEERLSSSAGTTLSNRTSYCSVDGGSAALAIDSKSFNDGEALTLLAASQSDQRLSVERVDSSRAHGNGNCNDSGNGSNSISNNKNITSCSLTSLCPVQKSSSALSVEHFNASPSASSPSTSSSSSSSICTPKSCKSSKPTTSAVKSKRPSHSPLSSHTPPARKSHTPNKWDAVMHKIASNKPLIKTNYNDVKSKVSTTRPMTAVNAVSASPKSSTGSPGARASPIARASPSTGVRRSPSLTAARSGTASPATPKSKPQTLHIRRNIGSNGAGVKTATPSPPPPSSTSTRQPQDKGSVGVGVSAVRAPVAKSPTSPPPKRFQSSSSALTKRGRSYSKDSQKSSQSDLSLFGNGNEGVAVSPTTATSTSLAGSDSAKPLAKTQLRAAKKRDVRNLSISPTDLGPPPKTQQTVKGQSTRTKSSTPSPTATKKYTNTSNLVSTCTSTSSLKNAKPTRSDVVIVSKSQSAQSVVHPKLFQKQQPTKQPLLHQKPLYKISEQQPQAKVVVLQDLQKKEKERPKADSKESIRLDQTELHELTGTELQVPKCAESEVKTKGKTRASTPPTTNEAELRATRHDSVGQEAKYKKIIQASTPPRFDATKPNDCQRQSRTHDASNPEDANQSGVNVIATDDQPMTAGADGIAAEDCRVNLGSNCPHIAPEQKDVYAAHRTTETSTSSQCGRSQSPPPVKPKPATGSRAGRCRLSVTKDLCSKCPSLKPFVKNEHLDCTSLEHFVANTHNRQKEQDKQVLGLAMVVQHISDELLKTNKACNKKPKTDYSSECPYTLEQATELLKDAQRKCEELRGQVHEKEADWMKDEKEMEHMFNCEMQKVLESHEKERLMTIERFRELEARVQQKEEESEQCLQTYRAEMARKLTHKQEQLKAAEEQVHKLQSCLQQAEAQEQQLREKCQCLENSNASNMAIANHREQELSDRIKVLTKELNTMRTNMEFNERDLRDRLALSQDEVSVLRKTRHCPNESKNAPTDAEVCRLTSEADSLRCVLELKQSEISTLTKKNAELKRENDERMNIMNKLTLLEAQNEMIRTELEAKCEKEKEYVRQIEEIQKAHTHDNYKCQRLSLDNEVLQYTLKHRSEQLQLVEAKLAELSSDNSHNFTHNRSSLGNNCSSRCGNHTSPPVSPIVKGVIEKNDSVSWVLEMDDETPQVAASKMVRRAGSLRCSSERSPTQRRQLSVSAGNSLCCNGSPTAAHGASSGAAAGPNPLSQSMSATSVIRTHSNESESRPHSRARSLSVCSKGTCDGCEKHKYARKSARRQRSGGDLQVPDWNEEAMRTSSPNHEIMRPRSSTIKLASPPQSRSELFSRASKASTLITCDSSSLTSGERLDMHSAYPSALKKKFHEIQESAGEAMVSGTNSEDESCSASSEDMGSSSSSTASAGQQLQKQQPPSRLFIEEALLLERANSLNGTPMEVSWSEDAVDATESVYSNGA